MNKDYFYFSQPFISPDVCDSFSASPIEKRIFSQMISEWNCRTCISDLCLKWRKVRPTNSSDSGLLILLFNVEGLNTHISDVDILLNEYKPNICILTGVGAASRELPNFMGYTGISQIGTNSFGGVAILYENSLKCKLIDKELNFISIEVQTASEPIIVGAIYVPPGSLPPFQIFNKYRNNGFYIFGDFNTKHTTWSCKHNNTSGTHMFNWLESTGNEMIKPTKSTSRRSDAIIDFGVTHDATGWNSEVLDEGTSDHWPVLFQAPIMIDKNAFFRQTNWNIFSFFLSSTYQYWNSLVYNFDTENFFSIFSSFLNALYDRCSIFKTVDKFRTPWPPSLVHLARTVNKARRAYRRYRSTFHLQHYLLLKEHFTTERASYHQSRRDAKLVWLAEGNNIWKYVKPAFRPYTPAFKGLTIHNVKVTEPQKIVDKLGDYYEKHFSKPQHDASNQIHQRSISIFENLAYMPAMPLEQIKHEEITREWKKLLPKKSTDSAGTSAFMLKKLPIEYLNILSVLFNKCAAKGEFFAAGKIAKIICLLKDGMYPAENKLRPISLLPNIAKLFERIIHRRILPWCHDQNIAVNEQSGFMQGRRLQTRILSLVENLRLTVAACNRPALAIFVDFLSAFDRMWFPALITNLSDLGMPLSILKWIQSWLLDRSFSISYGNAHSRNIPMHVGSPQGSVLAATLFRLHVHFLPSFFFGLSIHMFADDLAIVLSGALEKRLSINIIDLEMRAKEAMKKLELFSNNMLLPVNINKTKALLVHSAVSPSYPKIQYQQQNIEYVNCFKYLGVYITTKLGWGLFISNRLRTIRKIYKAMHIILRTIPLNLISMCRKIFLAFVLPHFCWLFCAWFYFTEAQKRMIEHVYCSGLRILYALKRWDDLSTLIICREKSLPDYIYSYWYRFAKHLEKTPDALEYQQSWQAFQTIKSNNKDWYKGLGFRRNSFFPRRLTERAQHSLHDWNQFNNIHKDQFLFYKENTLYLN